MPSGVEVRAEGVSKRYDGVRALEDVSLVARPGSVTVVAGPSGAGKTTLLRVIGGFEDPDSGRILYDGVDVTGDPPWERRAALLTQRPVLLPHLTVRENLVLAAEASGLGRGEARRAALEVAEMLGIEALLDRRPGSLSGGQLQRASLAAVLASRPRVLLLDEPFAHLDLPLREQFRVLVRRIARETGATVIQVTHDQDEAVEMADSLVVLWDGVVVDQGDPLRVYEDPGDPRAAVFLGHNITCNPGITGDPRACATFPPEALALGEGLEGRVEYVAHRLHYTLARIRVGDELLSMIVPRGTPIRPGDPVSVSLAGEMVKYWPVDEVKGLHRAYP